MLCDAPVPDLNFNSPDHHPSQDGSFIQDDAVEMQLIMELGTAAPPVGAAKANFAPTSVLTSSWISRAQAKWDRHANLDVLDDVPPPPHSESVVVDMDGSYWEDSPIKKDWNHNLKGSLLELSLSPTHSLFSSSGSAEKAGEESTEAERLEALLNAGEIPGFISTDSLDMSALMEDAELRAACATRKRDYVLTFEPDKMGDSVLAASSLDHYADAALSDASDRPLTAQSEPGPALSPVTTWGRIRRSYQFPTPPSPSTPKSFSLPNLCRSPPPLSLFSGAGENLSSVPIYDLNESMTSSQYQSCVPGTSGDGMSLLRAFQSKMRSGAVAALEDSQHSSGYVTGEGVAKAGPQVAMRNELAGSTPTQSLQDNQDPNFQPLGARVDDYDYSEFYVNGRYIDVNHNEIGFTPPAEEPAPKATSEVASPSSPVEDRWTTLASPRLTRVAPTKPPRTFASLLEKQVTVAAVAVTKDAPTSPTLIRASSSISMGQLRESGTQVPVYVVDQSVQTSCWDAGKLVRTSTTATTSVWSPTTSPGAPIYVGTKSFSDPPELPADSAIRAPGDPLPADLAFLKLSFSPPALFPHVAPFPLSLLNQSHLDPASMTQSQKLQLEPPKNEPEQEQRKLNPFSLDMGPPMSELRLPAMPTLMRLPSSEDSACPSGQSSSGTKSSPSTSKGVTRDRDSGLGSSGPAHIQDWDSLAALLPKDVVNTCSFFKVNNVLLNQTSHHSIDKPRKRVARLSRRAQKAKAASQRPVSEPSFERWRPHLPHTIYESIHEEGDAESPRAGGDCCGGHRHYDHGCARACPGSRLSSSCVEPHNCCPCFNPPPPCARLCRPCCPHSCRCSDVRGPTPRRNSLPRWRRYDRHQEPGSESESDAEDAWLGRHRDSDSSSCSEEDERWARKRPRPTSLGRRPTSYSMDNVRDHLDSSFLRGDTSGRDSGPVRGKSDVGETAPPLSSEGKPCATCFRLRSPSQERPPLWALKELRKWPEFAGCDCQTADVLVEMERDERRRRRSQNLVFFLSGLRAEEMGEEELAVRKTPLYLQKKILVERTLAEVDALVSAFSASRCLSGGEFREEMGRAVAAVWAGAVEKLLPALAALLSDGLLPGRSLWDLIKASTIMGPATKSIHELVSDLKSEDPTGDQTTAFFKGLLDLNSTDCWVSYLALKDRVVCEHYEDGGFMRRATSAYRSQFARLMMGLQSLSLLPFGRRAAEAPPVSASLRQFQSPRRPPPRSSSVPAVLGPQTLRLDKALSVSVRGAQAPPSFALLPTRLPPDSRIPKSSSVPSQLRGPGLAPPKSASTHSTFAKRGSPSRIPVLKDSPSLPNKTASFASAAAKPRFVCTIAAVTANAGRGILGCGKGETLELIGTPVGRFLRCRRKGEEGFVPRELATFVTFL